MTESSTTPAQAVSPELRARITSASAALEDFRREDSEFITSRSRMPDYVLWAVRLASELDHVLRQIGG